jgi:hypothetical protein
MRERERRGSRSFFSKLHVRTLRLMRYAHSGLPWERISPFEVELFITGEREREEVRAPFFQATLLLRIRSNVPAIST